MEELLWCGSAKSDLALPLANGLRYEQSPLKIDYPSKNLLRMNLNENIVMPLNRVRPIIAKCADEFDPRYYTPELGEGELRTLTNEIAKYSSCSSGSVALGFGSDQILDLVFAIKFGRSRTKLVTVDPTYSMYSILAQRLGAQVVSIKLAPSTAREPFSLIPKNVVQTSKKSGVKILVLASPNNPTGIQYPAEEILTIAESLPDTAIVIDEAYVEYAGYSMSKYLSRNRNLILVRTFSKAFGLANLRLGYLLSSDSAFVEKFISEFQYPYPVAGFAVQMATELLRRKPLILEYAEKTKKYRQELIEGLQRFRNGLSVISRSDANFVVVKSKMARKIAEDLLVRYAIAVKYIPKMGAESEFLRVTVGSREMNEKLLYSLRRIMAA